MQADEAVLIRCFDSAREGAARFSAHTGFEDPTSPPDAPPRESIEVRTLVFFPPGLRAFPSPPRKRGPRANADALLSWVPAFAGMTDVSELA